MTIHPKFESGSSNHPFTSVDMVAELHAVNCPTVFAGADAEAPATKSPPGAFHWMESNEV